MAGRQAGRTLQPSRNLYLTAGNSRCSRSAGRQAGPGRQVPPLQAGRQGNLALQKQQKRQVAERRQNGGAGNAESPSSVENRQVSTEWYHLLQVAAQAGPPEITHSQCSADPEIPENGGTQKFLQVPPRQEIYRTEQNE